MVVIFTNKMFTIFFHLIKSPSTHMHRLPNRGMPITKHAIPSAQASKIGVRVQDKQY